MTRVSLFAVLLMVTLSCVDAAEDMIVCYVMDSVLIAYSIFLTVLYIRLKLDRPTIHPKKADGVYAGLSPHISDTYETITGEKKAQM